MRSNERRAWLSAALACALASTLLGCGQKQERKPLPNWGAGYDRASDGGVAEDARVVDVPPGGFGIYVPDDVEYPYRLYEEGTDAAPCAVTLGSSHNDIRCIYDTDELDLFVLGFKLNIVTPKGGCDFVLYDPYFYESWPVGKGPSEVSYTINDDGSFSDEVNSENGVPVCEYNHAHIYPGGPNCCYGTYTLTVKSAKTGKTSVAHEAWGGEIISDCYDGGGFLLKGAQFDGNGFPADPIFYVDREHHVIPIVEEGFSAKYGYLNPEVVPTNVQLANYWNPKDGKPPQSIAKPDYTLTCLDDAQEVLARIRLQVRDWNEEVQFDTRSNPDTTGTERQFDSPINDIFDWKDIVDLGFEHNYVIRAKTL